MSSAGDGVRVGRAQPWQAERPWSHKDHWWQCGHRAACTEQPPRSLKHKGGMGRSSQEQNCILSLLNIMCIVGMFAEWFALPDPDRTAAVGS